MPEEVGSPANTLVTNDHDTLIRVDTKQDILIAEVKNMGSRFEVSLAKNSKDIDDLKLFQHDFSRTWKLIVGVSTTIGVVVGVVAQVITAAAHIK